MLTCDICGKPAKYLFEKVYRRWELKDSGQIVRGQPDIVPAVYGDEKVKHRCEEHKDD